LVIAELIEAAHKAIKRYVLYSKKVHPLRLNNPTKSDSPLFVRINVVGAGKGNSVLSLEGSLGITKKL
jgi:hypothetical protein